MLKRAFGDKVMDQVQIYEWFKYFINSTSVEDDEQCSRHHLSDTTGANTVKVCDKIHIDCEASGVCYKGILSYKLEMCCTATKFVL